jgi:CheY-like chemotaxis protein
VRNSFFRVYLVKGRRQSEYVMSTVTPSATAFVDDDLEFLRTMKAWQESVGMPTRTTAEPVRSLDWVRERVIDVLVTDLRMPGMQGVELLEKARQLNKAVRLVLLTGFEPTEAERARLNTIQAEIFSRTSSLSELFDSLIAGAPPYSTKRLVEIQERLELFEQMHREWVVDLLSHLEAIPDPEHMLISGMDEPTTVAQIMRDIRELTPRGVEHIRLWQNAMKTLRKLGRSRP